MFYKCKELDLLNIIKANITVKGILVAEQQHIFTNFIVI